MLYLFGVLLLLLTSDAWKPLDVDLRDCQGRCQSGSCCEFQTGRFHCCSFKNGVCCSSGNSCCPQGSQCNSDGITCSYPNGITVGQNVTTPLHDTPSVDVFAKAPSPVICPDRMSACPNNTTCCSMGSDSWGCCNTPNAVCCKDNKHCCPSGTKCNDQTASCDPTFDDRPNVLETLLFNSPFWPMLAKTRALKTQSSHGVSSDTFKWNGMAYAGVICNGSFECPSQTTCCLDTSDQFACCPLLGAVCCSDRVHCCPKDSRCDLEAQRCVTTSASHSQTINLVPSVVSNVVNRGHQRCPDGHSTCLSDQTCCLLSDKTWGCCPLPDAVCCSDGQHCCPSGFKCNLASKSCVKASVSSPPETKRDPVICANGTFQCDHGTMCCAQPNNEWGCCPFEKGVCCSDMKHCCPENTACDPVNQRCIKSSDSLDVPSLSYTEPRFNLKGVHNVCPGGLVSCPQGTCCKNALGIDACCPHPDAVCCQHGSCCPKGTICDEPSHRCIAADFSNTLLSFLWPNKFVAQPTPVKPDSNATPLKLNDRLCPDGMSTCEGDYACCLLVDDTYGCCPFANGVCCKDRHHCCPSGSECTDTGHCLRPLTPNAQQSISKASKTVTVIQPSAPQLAVHDGRPGEGVPSKWCGACGNDGFCCLDANGLPNQKCCPFPHGVCCDDGEHCCPKGTVCVGNGECQSKESSVERSSASFLVGQRRASTSSPEFLRQVNPNVVRHPLAQSAFKAGLNPMFMADSYYQANSHLFTVCPDRERVCTLEQRCCLSNRHGYVCVPDTSVCCSLESDTYCPFGFECSNDVCVKQDVSVHN